MIKLPANYDAAKQAISVCDRVDECAKWADAAAALRAYAYQMNDQTLEDRAKRIRARAVRRGGELLIKVKGKPGPQKITFPRNVNSKQAAKDAGLSPMQAQEMMRVARVNGESFERQVESANPPSIKELALQGTKSRPKPPDYREEYLDWTHAVRHLTSLPACGLEVFINRGPYTRDQLLQDSKAALANLNLWTSLITKGVKTHDVLTRPKARRAPKPHQRSKARRR